MIVIAQSRLFIFHFARMRFLSRMLDAFAVVPGCNAFGNSFRSMKHVTKKRFTDNCFIYIRAFIIFIRRDPRGRDLRFFLRWSAYASSIVHEWFFVNSPGLLLKMSKRNREWKREWKREKEREKGKRERECVYRRNHLPDKWLARGNIKNYVRSKRTGDKVVVTSQNLTFVSYYFCMQH